MRGSLKNPILFSLIGEYLCLFMDYRSVHLMHKPENLEFSRQSSRTSDQYYLTNMKGGIGKEKKRKEKSTAYILNLN